MASPATQLSSPAPVGPAPAAEDGGWQLATRQQCVDIVAPKHGKGRIKPRQGQLALKPCSLDLIAHTGRPPDKTPPSRIAAWLHQAQLPAFQCNSPANMWDFWEHLRTDRPALLLKCPFAQTFCNGWTMEILGQAFANDARLAEVLCSDARRSAFLIDDPIKNVFGGMYHVREPALQRLHMSVPDAVQVLSSWTERKAYVQVQLMGAPYNAGQATAASTASDELQDALKSGLDWAWLQDQQSIHHIGPLTSLTAEAASRGSMRPVQYNTKDRILFQVAGRRRVILFPPCQAFCGLYPFPVAHPYDTYVMPDFESPDLAMWPMLESVRGQSAILGPGDACFVPAYWFLAIEEMEEESWGLAARFGLGSRLPRRGSLALAAARAVEMRVAAAQGIDNVRRWLCLIGEGQEFEHMDLGTVTGYTACVMCTEVCEEVEACLGYEDNVCSELLLNMCRDRLVPTPWLNQGFREPLYLTDKPMVYTDCRTEEEKRYPEFFRHQTQNGRKQDVP